MSIDLEIQSNDTELDLVHEKAIVIEAEAGGYYTPTTEQIDEDTFRISFTPSKGSMLPIPPTDLTLQQGAKGEDGYSPQKGIDYFDGKDGTSVTITDITESTTDGGINVVTFSDGNTLSVKNGEKGDTPSMASIVEAIYPIGSIYMSVNSTSPADLFGGTWEAIGGRFLVGANVEYGAGSMGGSKYHNHTLSSSGYAQISLYKTQAKIGQTTLSKSSAFTADRSATISAAPADDSTTMNTATPLSGTTDTNWNTLPPYLAVYMWKRTA